MGTTTYITKRFDRLDKVCWNYYGNSNNRIVEWLLDQNQGLELYDIVLPEGITINLPDPPVVVTRPPPIKQIFLWD
jgi:phage tail protein X